MANNKNCELQDDAMSIFVKIMKKRHRKYELDGNFVKFIYNRKPFLADIDCEDDFVTIMFLHHIFIDKEDEAKFARLRYAVNRTNVICSVNTFYDENETTGDLVVLSRYTLSFITENPNFEMELSMALDDCIIADDVVKGLMKRPYNKRKKLKCQSLQGIVP